MFQLKFEIGGRRVDARNVGDALQRAAIQNVTEQIKNKIQSVKCAEHNEHASITVKGRSLSDLSFDVSGCCQGLIDAVTSKLK